MHGKLCIISTPIGNLRDITLRAIDELNNSDIILSEDTRNTLKLLNHYKIKKKIISYHKFNEKKSLTNIINEIKDGKVVSLVSDAGTPLISDPGYLLVKGCIKENIKIEVIPGPSSVLSGLILSGFNPERFYFAGFLSKKKNEKLKEIEKLKKLNCPVVIFESPFRVKETLKDILNVAGDLNAAVIKEITKVFEESFRGKISELIKNIPDDKLKGEFVIIFQPEEKTEIEGTNLKEEIKEMLKDKLSVNEVAKRLSKKYNIKKSQIYNEILKVKTEDKNGDN